MDSGRKALLEKAREFGSLAHNMTFQDFLDKSVTYRTLALYLGIQKEWWEEFWRSFCFAAQQGESNKVRAFRFCCKAKDLLFVMSFLADWFGRDTAISDISKEELNHVYHLVMCEETNGRGNSQLIE